MRVTTISHFSSIKPSADVTSTILSPNFASPIRANLVTETPLSPTLIPEASASATVEEIFSLRATLSRDFP